MKTEGRQRYFFFSFFSKNQIFDWILIWATFTEKDKKQTYRIDFASMDRVATVTMPVYFGYLVVAAVVLDAFVAIVDASYLAVFQPVARHPFVCTCPYAGPSDVPENLYRSTITHYVSAFLPAIK